MKKFFIKVFFILIICGLVGCTTEKDWGLEVSSDTVVLNESANYGSFIVIAGGPWTISVSSGDDWVRVSPDKGDAGNVKINVKGDSNPGKEQRQAELTVSCGSQTRNVTVVQEGVPVGVNGVLKFPKEGSTVSADLYARENVSWHIEVPSDVADVSVTPDRGTGPAEISVTLGENPGNRIRTLLLSIVTSEAEYPIEIEQEAGENHIPSKAVLLSPENGQTDLNRYVRFTWSAAEDTDGDRIAYYVEYSVGGAEWTSSEKLDVLTYTVASPLQASSTYSWRVKAEDEFGGVSYSDVWSFTTNDGAIAPDGSWSQYTKNGLTGTIPVIFIGDGFVEDDYEAGGHFDTVADEGIENFFATPPFSTYRENFTAYKVVAYSEESGASRWTGSSHTEGEYVHKVNTCFDTKYFGDGYTGTYMTTNEAKVYSYAKKIPGITDAELNKTVVVLIVNDPVYSGTCWQSWEGRSIGIVPLCQDARVYDWFKQQEVDYHSPYSYKETMAHEAAGHGFGRLADEYVFDQGAATQEAIENLKNWENATPPMNPNVDYRPREECKWNVFFGREGYEKVGYYSGAQYAGGGIYMSERSSVMRDMNYCYYNAASRMSIVRRIYENTGKGWGDAQIEKFIAKDLESGANVAPSMAAVKSSGPAAAHTPPQISVLD